MNEPAAPKLRRPLAPPYIPRKRTLRGWLLGTLAIGLPLLLFCYFATSFTIAGTACDYRPELGYVPSASTLTTHGFPFTLLEDYTIGCYEGLRHIYEVNWLGLLGDFAFWLTFAAGAYYFISDLWFKASYFRIPVQRQSDIMQSGIIEAETSAKEQDNS